jgi:hypothetical protein
MDRSGVHSTAIRAYLFFILCAFGTFSLGHGVKREFVPELLPGVRKCILNDNREAVTGRSVPVTYLLDQRVSSVLSTEKRWMNTVSGGAFPLTR